MATRSLDIGIESLAAPDNTTTNKAAAFTWRKSSGTAPAPYSLIALFDATAVEWVNVQFKMPVDYVSTLVCKLTYSMASATANGVVFDVRIAAITPGDAIDADADVFGSANTGTGTVPATAGYEQVISVTMTNDDGVAAGDSCNLYIARLSTDGSDTATGDLELRQVELQYSDV